MRNIMQSVRRLLTLVTRSIGVGMGIALVIVIALAAGVSYLVRGCGASTQQEARIGLTPVEISEIRSIGQWEFLSISDEELVDTVRHGFLGDDELSRIYYGTLRLGIDLDKAADPFVTTDHDTVVVTLPPIQLLDSHFIDEARTRAFYEEGKWSEADKAALTRRAAAIMRQRCLTPSNIRSAQQNASAQMTQLLRSMGYRYSRIRFQEQTAR